MSDLWPAFFTQDNGNDVEAKGAVFDVMHREKIAGGAVHSCFLVKCDGRLGGTKVLIRPGLDLDKDERPIGIDHNQVKFAGLASEITRERFEALSFEKSLAAFLAPSAEQRLVR